MTAIRSIVLGCGSYLPERVVTNAQLAAQIEFTEWTPDGYLRQASFTGMRGDKDPRRTVREQRFSSLTIADAASMTKGFF